MFSISSFSCVSREFLNQLADNYETVWKSWRWVSNEQRSYCQTTTVTPYRTMVQALHLWILFERCPVRVSIRTPAILRCLPLSFQANTDINLKIDHKSLLHDSRTKVDSSSSSSSSAEAGSGCAPTWIKYRWHVKVQRKTSHDSSKNILEIQQTNRQSGDKHGQRRDKR
jgi:hypothetical protein